MKQTGIFDKGAYINDIYQVQIYLGESDCCEVYRIVASDEKLYFLKIIQPDLLAYVGLKALENNLEKANLLNHSYLLKQHMLQSFTHEGQQLFYFLEDFYPGESLRQLLTREFSLGYKRSCEIMACVALVMSYLHENFEFELAGISPDHIYLNYTDQKVKVHLAATRVSSFINDERLPTNEKINLAYKRIDSYETAHSIEGDIFSFLVVFYKCITGALPWDIDIDWEDMNTSDIKKRLCLHRQSYTLTPVSHYKEVGLNLDEVFAKGLKQLEGSGYSSMDGLLEALKAPNKEAGLPSFGYPKLLSTNSLVSPQASASPRNDNKDKRGLAAIAGMDNLKELLRQDIVQPVKNKKDYRRYGIQPLNGILFFGPPGCGKTYITRKLAEEMQCNFIEVKPSDLASIYIHGTQEKIGKLFREAEILAPSVIFIDEIDAILPTRSQADLNHAYAAAVNEFLAQMNECSAREILVVGATNRPENIDPAILRTGRLDKQIYVGLPDFSARLALLEFYIESRPVASDLNLYNIAMLTSSYIASDIKYLVNEASKHALKEDQLIADEHFATVLKKFSPSVTGEQIEQIKKFGLK